LTRAGYRLPTEVEWEYACRAGTTTARYFGHSVEYLRWYAWYMGNSDGSLRPGGLLLPNDLGLFDMYGNVQEWCQSSLHGTPDGMHVVRGSTDQSQASIVRSAFRQGLHRFSKFAYTGFRIARTIPPSTDTRQGVNDD
jgi:formylglycine-generating enzyme required for sulfatase activity